MTGRFETQGNVVFLGTKPGRQVAVRRAAASLQTRSPFPPARLPAWLVIVVGMAVVLPAAFLALTAWFVTWLGFLCVLIGATAIPDIVRRSIRNRVAGVRAAALLCAPLAG